MKKAGSHLLVFTLFVCLISFLAPANPGFCQDGGGGSDGGDSGGAGFESYFDVQFQTVTVLQSELDATIAGLQGKGIKNYNVYYAGSNFNEIADKEYAEAKYHVAWMVLVEKFHETASSEKDHEADKPKSQVETQPKELIAVETPEADEGVVEAMENAPDMNEPAAPAELSQAEIQEIQKDLSPEDKAIAEKLSLIDVGGGVTPQDREKILATVDEEYREGTRAMLENDPMAFNNKAQLLGFVQEINALSADQAAQAGDRAKAIEDSLGYIDSLGQKSQTVLSFVPGVGWAWSVGLDSARAGADSYREGKSAQEVLTNAVVSGGLSYFTNKVIGGSSLGNAKTPGQEALSVLKGQKANVVGYERQLAGFLTSKVASNALENQVSVTTYTPGVVPGVVYEN